MHKRTDCKCEIITIEQCKSARKTLDWSAKDLAKAAGVDISIVERFEAGSLISVTQVDRISDAIAAQLPDFQN